jgi:hypothetical protein
MKDVHTEHCCKWHGCKYGNKDCTVIKGAAQSYPCEFCSMDWQTYLETKALDPEWIEYITRWKNDGGQV